MTAPATLQIDFVSDVVCPWCAIGLHALEQAAARLEGQVALQWRFHPFELNPAMGQDGEDLLQHLAGKYGSSAAQMQQMHEAIAARGAQLGFVFDQQRRTRIVNTFDAHRLLHWQKEQGAEGGQRALEHALFTAYFTRGEDVSDHAVLLALVASLGLDEQRAAAILAGDEYAGAVRQQEAQWQARGIHSVPAIVINGRHLIQGGQPVEVFEQALRRIAAL
ncbi:DsbA family oxidoreductase [Comamonas faecalis]|uniref:DsbA family oxidoreductase n=1 Tax=Comamonas faecalis TaxID=1387849 RepID=A0ABP7QJM6_9BURK